MFFNNSERMHAGKANAEAERLASHTAATRAENALVVARADAKAATPATDKVRGLDAKACGPKCMSIRATETMARTRSDGSRRRPEKSTGIGHGGSSAQGPGVAHAIPSRLADLHGGLLRLDLFRRSAKPVGTQVLPAKPAKKTARKRTPKKTANVIGLSFWKKSADKPRRPTTPDLCLWEAPQRGFLFFL
jgi:hypothetical protein